MAGELGIRQALRKTLREALSAGRGIDLRGIRLGPDLTGPDVALLRARIGSLSAFRIGPTNWAVTSASREGWAYLVNAQPNGATQCNCEARRQRVGGSVSELTRWRRSAERWPPLEESRDGGTAMRLPYGPTVAPPARRSAGRELWSRPASGRGGGTRTPNLCFWRALLCQLSYTPTTQQPV